MSRKRTSPEFPKKMDTLFGLEANAPLVITHSGFYLAGCSMCWKINNSSLFSCPVFTEEAEASPCKLALLLNVKHVLNSIFNMRL
jgi:hypothetical protein